MNEQLDSATAAAIAALLPTGAPEPAPTQGEPTVITPNVPTDAELAAQATELRHKQENFDAARMARAEHDARLRAIDSSQQAVVHEIVNTMERSLGRRPTPRPGGTAA